MDDNKGESDAVVTSEEVSMETSMADEVPAPPLVLSNEEGGDNDNVHKEDSTVMETANTVEPVEEAEEVNKKDEQIDEIELELANLEKGIETSGGDKSVEEVVPPENREPASMDTSAVDVSMESSDLADETQTLENPAEVDVNEGSFLNKTDDNAEKDNDEEDPMNTVDHREDPKETEEVVEEEHLDESQDASNADTSVEQSMASESVVDSTLLATEEINDETNDNFDADETNKDDANDTEVMEITQEDNDNVEEIQEEEVIEESIADMEDGKGADEEVSLLPEREISEADMESAIQPSEEEEEVEDDPATSADVNDITEDADPEVSINEEANLDKTNDSVVLIEDEDVEPAATILKDFEIKDTVEPHVEHNCDQCQADKLCEFYYTEIDTDKYICTMACIQKLRADNPDKFTLHVKKIPIITIMEQSETCVKCDKKSACNYRYKNKDDTFVYLCKESCVTEFMSENENRYVFKKKIYLVDEPAVVSDKENKCIQCSETKVCKFSLKQDSQELWICKEVCLNLLLKEQPDKIRVKRRSGRVREVPSQRAATPHSEEAVSLEGGKIVARTEEEAELAQKDRENSFIRHCGQCSKVLEDPEKFLTWETSDYCDEYCLGQYQKVIGSSCAQCKKYVTVTSLGKYCVRFGYSLKQFCCSKCLDEYKRGLKTCAYCQKDISSGIDGILAPVGEKGKYKDFCSQTCMKTYDDLCNPKKKPVSATCAVCNNEKIVRVSVKLDGKVHKFCSNPCFSAFKFVNNIIADQCQMCQDYFERKTSNNFTIYNNTRSTIFCTQICMHIHIVTTRKIVPCNWCKVKKYNFDMIMKIKGNQPFLMCSLNCLTLCEVSVNAMTQKSLKCDQCNTSTTPQYLLSMSDATVRNFCTYQCVMSFQSQFSKSPLLMEVEQQRHQPIPTGLPKRVKSTAVAPVVQTVMAPASSKPNKNAKHARVVITKTTKPQPLKPTSSVPIISSVQSLAGTSAAAGISTRNSIRKGPPGKPSSTPTQKGFISAVPFQELKISLERIDLSQNILNQGSSSISERPSDPPQRKRGRPALNKSASYRADNSGSESGSLYHTDVSPVSAPAPPAEVKTQIVVVPPLPKKVSNMTTMCKPIMQTKGVTCRPQMVSVECQTDDSLERKIIIPIPVPLYIPQPMHMYSLPAPIPVPIPLPIPVPIFIPTTRNSAAGIMKEITKIQDKMPADPYEAELLMMAEMVAGEKKKNESDSSDDDDDRHNDTNDYHHSEPIESANASFGEDMLTMALKLATEYDEPAVDLESAMPSNTITPAPHMAGEEIVESADLPHHLLMLEQQRVSNRGRKRGPTNVSPRNAPRNNLSPITPVKKIRRAYSPPNMIPEPQQPEEREPAEKADAHMKLKFTFGVNAWKQWVMTKNADLEKSSIRRKLFKSDLLQLTADELNYSLCLFVKEVRKPNGSEYAPDTIYYLVLGIQQYLFEHNRIDNIFTDPYYEKFTDCLDEVARKFSVLYNDSQFIVTRVEEEHLWECKQLGAHSPHVLLSTLMFFNTKHFNLTTVEEHMQLSFSHIMKHWKRNPNQAAAAGKPGQRNVLLRFYPPQSSLDSNVRKKKVYEQQENEENPLRCPVKLYEFYLSKCPESVKTRNDVFYLQPERSCVPDSPVWYSTQALSKDALCKMLHRIKMVKEINIAILTS